MADNERQPSADRRPTRRGGGAKKIWGRKRSALGAVLAILVTGTAGAYVPSSTLAPRPAPAPAPAIGRPELDSARDFERVLARLDEQERRLVAEIKELGPQQDLVRSRMIARGRYYYRLVRAGLLPVGGGFDSLVDHATRVERLRSALTRDIGIQARLKQRQAAARKELRRIRAERAPLTLHREAMKRARVAMQQAEERRAAFHRAFGNSTPSPHLTIYGAGTGPVDSEPVARFAAMRGRLSFPLAGRAEVRTSNQGDVGPGLWLLGSRDTGVRSVYPGRVAFAGRTAHGLTVVVDHGDRYFTLYGNLQRVDVEVGESLSERSRPGWVMRHGGGAPQLYFELRRGQSVLNAAPWLGL